MSCRGSAAAAARARGRQRRRGRQGRRKVSANLTGLGQVRNVVVSRISIVGYHDLDQFGLSPRKPELVLHRRFGSPAAIVLGNLWGVQIEPWSVPDSGFNRSDDIG